MLIQILRQGFYQSLRQALFNTLLAVAEALEIIKKREMTERVNKKAAMLKEQEAMIIAGAAALGLGGTDTVDMTAESD